MIQQRDLATGRLKKLGQQVENRGLAGAIGSDQGVDLCMMHVQIDIVDGGEAQEILTEAAGG